MVYLYPLQGRTLEKKEYVCLTTKCRMLIYRILLSLYKRMAHLHLSQEMKPLRLLCLPYQPTPIHHSISPSKLNLLILLCLNRSPLASKDPIHHLRVLDGPRAGDHRLIGGWYVNFPFSTGVS